MTLSITPVILSGGSGSRLWPLSRAKRPKQFLGVTEELSLFQLTLQRLHDIPGIQAPVIVSNQEHRFLVAEQCREAGVVPDAILLEPFGTYFAGRCTLNTTRIQMKILYRSSAS
jgi:mannose-1-phosphate guanylyltransferase